MMPDPDEPSPSTLETAQSAIWAFARSLAAAVLAGALAGALAGGLGGRLAMRISAIAAGDAQQGAITDAEEIVGEITFDGTVGLIIFGGILIGIFGGLLYLALRPWLRDAGQWRGLAFGVLLLAMFGWAVIEGDNPDFHRFGPPALNIAMFASIFVVFGLLVVPLFDWIERALPPLLPRRSLGPIMVPTNYSVAGVGSLFAHGFALLVFVGIVGGVVNGFGEEGREFTLMPLYALVAAPAASILLARATGRFERLSDLRGRWGALGAALVVVGAVVAVGLVLDIQALVDIFQADEVIKPRRFP